MAIWSDYASFVALVRAAPAQDFNFVEDDIFAAMINGVRWRIVMSSTSNHRIPKYVAVDLVVVGDIQARRMFIYHHPDTYREERLQGGLLKDLILEGLRVIEIGHIFSVEMDPKEKDEIREIWNRTSFCRCHPFQAA